MTDRGFTILAVDPGLTGALAWYAPFAPEIITVDDMPVVAGDVDPAALARRIRQMSPNAAVVERVGARPGQGVSSMFKFGCGYGMVQGVIASLGIPIHLVTPGKWKRHYALPADKEEARARAIKLWPTCDRFARKRIPVGPRLRFSLATEPNAFSSFPRRRSSREHMEGTRRASAVRDRARSGA
jgi:hypothetical protein